MTLTVTQTLITIAAIVLGTLPPALMGLIVVYCFKNVPILTGNHGLPELIASVVVILTYEWKENLLLSVGGGTLVYMLLVQFVF